MASAARRYDNRTWRYATSSPAAPSSRAAGEPQNIGELVGRLARPSIHQDATLRHERCVLQILRRHYRRYTPELVEQVCGAWPSLGEFRGLEQVRFLRCGLCAMSWEFPRLQCPFCGNDDHRQLGYLHQEGEESKHRVATCDACRGYIKMVATLGPLEPVRLLVMDVATLPLDLVAAERGYAVP